MIILAGTLYRFTSPPSKRTCVSIAMSANLKKSHNWIDQMLIATRQLLK
jgi:hypothetical protein